MSAYIIVVMGMQSTRNQIEVNETTFLVYHETVIYN